jgi:hypothetical protein
MFDEKCKNCGEVLNREARDVEFFDERTGSELTSEIEALWCDSCDYVRIRKS